MEIFHKGCEPPLIFGSYGTGGTHLILVTKKGKNQTFSEHTKWPYLKELFFVTTTGNSSSWQGSSWNTTGPGAGKVANKNHR